MADPKYTDPREEADRTGNFANYEPGHKEFYTAYIPKPRLAYPASIKDGATSDPFIHLNIVDPVASAPRTDYAIGLYMPTSIRVSYNASWEEVQLGVIGGEMYNAAIGAPNAAGLTFNEGLKQFSNAGSAILGKGAINALDSTGLNLGATAQKIARIMVNPHAALLFNGMSFREFKLDFAFFPKSAKESEEISNIIFQLKYAMHPEGFSGIGGSVATTPDLSRYLQYPNNFIIGFYAPEMHWLFRTSPCSLISCDIEYNGSGVPSFFQNTNEPVCVTMSLHFKENEMLTKQRIRKGW